VSIGLPNRRGGRSGGAPHASPGAGIVHAAVSVLSQPLSETAERRLKLAMDVGERTFSVLMFGYMAINFLPTLTTAPINDLLLLSEGLVTVFMVLRRFTQDVSTRPFDWMAALAGTAAPMAVHAPDANVHRLAPQALLFGIWIFGVALSIWGKLSLRRSFGLAAANRGVMQGGPYRLVRHPVYAGYMMTYVFSILANPQLFNGLLYLGTVTLIVIRVLAEERVLKSDPAYFDFMGRVKFRLVPGLF